MSTIVLGNGDLAKPTHLEVLLTSESSGQFWNSCLWDPGSGSALTTYKGHTSVARTLTLVGDTFLVSARPSKPVLNLWHLNRHEQQPQVISTPGPCTALAATPSGKYLAGGIKDKVYVWQTGNGILHRYVSLSSSNISRPNLS